MRIRLAALLVVTCSGAILLSAQTLRITPIPEQSVIAGENYTLPLAATGGSLPYTWQLVAGELPPGLKLHSHSGHVAGAATVPGDYRFTVSVTDSSVPHFQVQRDLIIRVIAGLTIDWKEPPAVHGDRIAGSALVSNRTPHAFDLTVIVVAVNSIGRATTLGYQHFKLPADTASEVIPFGSSPGVGTYVVRADAVASRGHHQHIFRASKQTADSLRITQF